MTIPTHEDAMLPVLEVLSDGLAYHRRALADAMAGRFQLTPEERAALLPSGKSPVIRSRTGWALSYMKQAGLVQSPRRGWYEITDLGRQALSARPPRIDNDYLMRFEGFRDFRARSKAAEAENVTRIILIDGRRLATLMFEYNVGVSPRNTYTVKTLDGDYFEDS